MIRSGLAVVSFARLESMTRSGLVTKKIVI